MIGKVIASGDTRDTAIARMRNALAELVVEGIKTNIPSIRRSSPTPPFPRRHRHPLSGAATGTQVTGRSITRRTRMTPTCADAL